MGNYSEGQSKFGQLKITNVKETGKVLGRGSYGEVGEAYWRGTRCATKKPPNVFLDPTLCHTWSRLRHPNIVQLFGVVFEKGSNLPVLVLEIMPTTLRIHLETRSKREFLMEQKIAVLHQVALGLAYLHGQNLVYLNLSTNKVLLHPDHGTVKLTDFGFMRSISSDGGNQTGSTVPHGAYAFMPLEVLNMPPNYNDRADVFSLGCVFLSTLSHAWPQPLAAKVKKDGKLVALSELERRTQYFDGINQAERTLFESHIELCLKEEADGRPCSLSIAEALGELQQSYRGQSLEERVCEQEAMVGSLEACTEELQAENEELMQANTAKQCTRLETAEESRSYTSGSKSKSTKEEKVTSGGSGWMKQWSWSSHCLESTRPSKIALSLPREVEELRVTPDTHDLRAVKKEIMFYIIHKATNGVKSKKALTGQGWMSPTVPPDALSRVMESIPSTPEGDIRFHRRGEPYYEFHPSFLVTLRVGDRTYESCEDYLVAQMSARTDVKTKYSWRCASIGAMEEALYVKFTQHEELLLMLLATATRNIIYHHRSDDLWGDGGYGEGQNQLGVLLMGLRKSFMKPFEHSC